MLFHSCGTRKWLSNFGLKHKMAFCNQKSFHNWKPFIAVVFLQFGYAGMDILSKSALNKGMSNYVLVVYRHAVAFVVIVPFAVILEKYCLHSPLVCVYMNLNWSNWYATFFFNRKVRPKMTLSIFMKLVALSVLE